MVSLNVLLGGAGAAGFTFGWIRIRWADIRGSREPADPEDLAEHRRGAVPDIGTVLPTALPTASDDL